MSLFNTISSFLSSDSDREKILEIYNLWKSEGTTHKSFDKYDLLNLNQEKKKQIMYVAFEMFYYEENGNTFDDFILEILSFLLSEIQSYSSNELKNLIRLLSLLMACRIFPLGNILNNISQLSEENQIDSDFREVLKIWYNILPDDPQLYSGKGVNNEKRILQRILFSDSPISETASIFFSEDDNFGSYANELLGILDISSRAYWFKMMSYSKSYSSSKPTQKFVNEMNIFISEIGESAFVNMASTWMEHMEKMIPTEKKNVNYLLPELICSDNRDILKGLLWMLGSIHNDICLQLLYRGALIFFKKIPDKGPASIALGNICIGAMSEFFGLQGITYLFMVRHKVKHPNTIKTIEKNIQKIGKEIGYSLEELEDISIQDFGILDGKWIYNFNLCEAILIIQDDLSVTLSWKYDNKPVKIIASNIQESFEKEIKEIKQRKKELGILLSLQKYRFEELLLTGRKIEYSHFKKYFLQHQIVGLITKKCIWNIYNLTGQKINEIFFSQGIPIDINNQEIFLEDGYTLQIYHPIEVPNKENEDWKNFLYTNNIYQPVRQIGRELFHKNFDITKILECPMKQHQAVALAKERHWKANLQGDFDSGDNGFIRDLRVSNLHIVLHTEANRDIGITPMGIFTEIITKEIVWKDSITHELVLVKNIPERIFSEIIRDILLFVSVSEKKKSSSIIDFLESL